MSIAVVPAAASEAEAEVRPTRVMVGFHELPDTMIEGDVYDGATIVRSVPEIRMISVHTFEPASFMARQAADPNVAYVVNDDPVPLLLDDTRAALPPDVGMLLTPNDPQYGSMYGPQQVRANLAWDTTLGDMDAAVCVIDTGVRTSHEDLGTARYLGGYDFVNNDNNPADDQGHGTHVAGTAVGTIGNAKGVAGMGNVGYYAVKVLDAGGSGSYSDVAAGVTWCANNGIPRTVLSLSLGGGSSDPGMDSALHYAYATKGMLVVAASGNGYCNNCVSYPGRHAEVVGVACTNSALASCAFTSKGPEVDIAAPGEDVLSTCYGSDTQYCSKSGTSMSTPHVSGILALVWSHETSLTAAQLWQRLNETAKDLGTAGKDQTFGWGRIDALCLITNTLCNTPPPPTFDLFVEDFESGAPGWTFTGLWHTSTCRSLSTTTSIAYNKVGTCPQNYDTGAANSGEATSPSLAIPADATYVRLKLGSWYQTEGGTSWDKKLVQLSADNGTFVQVLQEASGAGAWNSHELDLAGYAGKSIQVKFRFDTVDGVANAYEGWYVDDVKLLSDVALGPPTVPGAPVVTVVGGPLPGELKLTWPAPSSGGSPITGYTILRADSASGPFDPLSTTTGLSYVDSGLGDGVTKFYKVYATNEIGDGPLSAAASGTTFSVPGAPVNLAANAGPGAGQISLSWSAGSNGGTPITKYTVYRATNASGPFVLRANVTTPAFVDSGLAEATRYWYRVSATNIVGEGEQSIDASARTFARPSAPLNLAARPGGQLFSIDLSWQAPSDSGGTPVTSYRVYRDGVYIGSSAVITFRDRNLDPTDAYEYQISAVNLVGEGPKGNVACARPNPWPAFPVVPQCEILGIGLAFAPPEGRSGTA